MSELTLAALPGTDVAPAGARRSEVRRHLVRSAFSRRSILKGALVAMSASALSSVDGLLRLSGAQALPPTWTHCSDYVGSSWDNGWWTQCNPYANDVDGNAVEIGSGFCNSDNYHRNDTVAQGYNDRGDRIFRIFERRPYSCKDRNAWVWRIAHNPAAPNPADRRCSDGKYRYDNFGDGNWHYSVCQFFL